MFKLPIVIMFIISFGCSNHQAPGRDWYTEILGPFLKDKGELYMTIFCENSNRSYAPKLK